MFKCASLTVCLCSETDVIFCREIPSEVLPDFEAETEESKFRMDRLKNEIRQSSLEVFDNYPAHYGGIVNEKPITTGLDEFGKRVINNIWNALETLYPVEVSRLFHETCLSLLCLLLNYSMRVKV